MTPVFRKSAFCMCDHVYFGVNLEKCLTKDYVFERYRFYTCLYLTTFFEKLQEGWGIAASRKSRYLVKRWDDPPTCNLYLTADVLERLQ